jgi:hypothetical protein
VNLNFGPRREELGGPRKQRPARRLGPFPQENPAIAESVLVAEAFAQKQIKRRGFRDEEALHFVLVYCHRLSSRERRTTVRPMNRPYGSDGPHAPENDRSVGANMPGTAEPYAPNHLQNYRPNGYASPLAYTSPRNPYAPPEPQFVPMAAEPVGRALGQVLLTWSLLWVPGVLGIMVASDHAGLWEPFVAGFGLLMLVGWALHPIGAALWQYKAWSGVLPEFRRTETRWVTPGAAAGFLFVPYFHYYWMFVVGQGIIDAANAQAEYFGSPLRVNRRDATIACIIQLLFPLLSGIAWYRVTQAVAASLEDSRRRAATYGRTG